MGTQIYVNDHKDRLPDSGSGPGGGDVVRILRPYTDTKFGRGIWRCGSHENYPNDYGWTSSYGYNIQYLLAPGATYPHTGYSGFDNLGLKLTEIKRMDGTFGWVDHTFSATPDDLWSYVARPNEIPIDGFGRTEFRHANAVNVGYLDGHVAPMGEEFGLPINEALYWDPRQ